MLLSIPVPQHGDQAGRDGNALSGLRVHGLVLAIVSDIDGDESSPGGRQVQRLG